MNYNLVKFDKAIALVKDIPYTSNPEIVFSGKSNVGKSSLINTIFNRKGLARTSSVPGKTITINYFSCENVNFVDLPGYGFAKTSKQEKDRFSKLTDAYFSMDRNIKLVIQLIDVRNKPSQNDLMMIDYLKNSDFNFIIALTKCDKLKKNALEKRLKELPNELNLDEDILIPTSSQTRIGIQKIKSEIERSL